MEPLTKEVVAKVYMTPDRINVLDKGYVRLVDHMGTDLSVVNAARASYAKEVTELGAADVRLIHFLIREGHFSTLRHAFVTLEVKAPLMIARQWFKHATGSAHSDSFSNSWNENSRRYITADEEFYHIQTTEWRSKPENSKQGSGEPVDPFTGAFYTEAFEKWSEEGHQLYKAAMDAGICAEQARVFLPAYSLYVTWRWSCSLQALMYFCDLRLAHDSQVEIQKYAKAVYRLAQPLFPVTFDAFELTRND